MEEQMAKSWCGSVELRSRAAGSWVRWVKCVKWIRLATDPLVEWQWTYVSGEYAGLKRPMNRYEKWTTGYLEDKEPREDREKTRG